jgi:hypothetical protein
LRVFTVINGSVRGQFPRLRAHLLRGTHTQPCRT